MNEDKRDEHPGLQCRCPEEDCAYCKAVLECICIYDAAEAAEYTNPACIHHGATEETS